MRDIDDKKEIGRSVETSLFGVGLITDLPLSGPATASLFTLLA
jgi:hypothetical protein